MLNSILVIVIVVLIGLAVIAMIRYQQNTILALCVMAVLLVSGVYSGFTAYRYYSTYSAVYGTYQEHDPYEDFNFFEYDIPSLTWYQENTGSEDEPNIKYYYSTEYGTSIAFNGSDEDYVLLINNKPCVTKSSNGRLHGEQTLSFYNIDGILEEKFNISVDFTFYASKILLKVETDATNDNIGYLKEYVKVNGFNLRILNELPYHSADILQSQAS